MSLATVNIPANDFDYIYDHMVSFKPKYKNIQMREAKTKNKKRILRYLHIMKALKNKKEIHGRCSGPEIEVVYSISNSKGNTQVTVFSEKGTQKEIERFAKRFLIEVLNKVSAENNMTNNNYSNYKSGEFYVRRWPKGTAISHPNCQKALNNGQLDHSFLNVLSLWKFQLVHP